MDSRKKMRTGFHGLVVFGVRFIGQGDGGEKVRSEGARFDNQDFYVEWCGFAG